MKATSKFRNYRGYGRNIMIGALAATVLTTLGASQAQAVDGKLYPGSSCVRWQGSSPIVSFSRLFNPGTTVMRLDCPVVHDFIDESIQDGYVDVLDRNFGSSTDAANVQVCADLVSISQALSSTLTVRSTGRRCSVGASSVSQRLSFGGLAANRNAHYYYSVSIPPTFNGQRSALISYEVDEND
jgi:hypothetical protein